MREGIKKGWVVLFVMTALLIGWGSILGALGGCSSLRFGATEFYGMTVSLK